jgi:hypothetical protein
MCSRKIELREVAIFLFGKNETKITVEKDATIMNDL